MKRLAAITAVGGYVPEKILSNKELESMVDTNDRWIQDRTGIKERRILSRDKATSDMVLAALEDLFSKTSVKPQDIELVICATVSPDHVYPATANIVASRIGAVNAWGYDLSAACSGFLYALRVGSQFIETGAHQKVLVVGADTMSIRVDYEDRNTCVLFGDGAGAVLLEPNEEGLGVIDAMLKSDGNGSGYLCQLAGGSRRPTSLDTIRNKEHYIHQDGRTVFKAAVSAMADITADMMEKHQLTSEDIAYLVPHQANRRIIDATANRAGLPEEKVMVNIDRYGNTTCGTIPLCLWEWEHKLTKGDNLLLAAFGGGFTWGTIFVKWAYNGADL